MPRQLSLMIPAHKNNFFIAAILNALLPNLDDETLYSTIIERLFGTEIEL